MSKRVWGRWKELTRFRLACEMALSAYRKTLTELPLKDFSALEIADTKGTTTFECSYADFIKALNEDRHLYGLLVVAHVSLAEEHGRVIVQELLDSGLVARNKFAGMRATGSAAEATDAYVQAVNVEAWGASILKCVGRTWADVPGGQLGAVRAFVARNLIAHGLVQYNATAVNRLTNVDAGHGIVSGSDLDLSREAFQTHLANLRGFMRTTDGTLATLKKRSGT